MKTLTNINVLLCIVYICILAHNTHSLRIHDGESDDEIPMEPYLIDDTSSSVDEYGSIENPFAAQEHPFLGKRRTDSAEKYFNWAGKTNRPMEYLRGKRFWLFTKKDEHTVNQEAAPSVSASSNSLHQGIWRSGIVGRRRR